MGIRVLCCRPQDLPGLLLCRPLAAGSEGDTQICQSAERHSGYWGGVRATALPLPAGQPPGEGTSLERWHQPPTHSWLLAGAQPVDQGVRLPGNLQSPPCPPLKRSPAVCEHIPDLATLTRLGFFFLFNNPLLLIRCQNISWIRHRCPHSHVLPLSLLGCPGRWRPMWPLVLPQL